VGKLHSEQIREMFFLLAKYYSDAQVKVKEIGVCGSCGGKGKRI